MVCHFQRLDGGRAYDYLSLGDIRSGTVESIQDSGTTAPPIPEAVG